MSVVLVSQWRGNTQAVGNWVFPASGKQRSPSRFRSHSLSPFLGNVSTHNLFLFCTIISPPFCGIPSAHKHAVIAPILKNKNTPKIPECYPDLLPSGSFLISVSFSSKTSPKGLYLFTLPPLSHLSFSFSYIPLSLLFPSHRRSHCCQGHMTSVLPRPGVDSLFSFSSSLQ